MLTAAPAIATPRLSVSRPDSCQVKRPVDASAAFAAGQASRLRGSIAGTNSEVDFLAAGACKHCRCRRCLGQPGDPGAGCANPVLNVVADQACRTGVVSCPTHLESGSARVGRQLEHSRIGRPDVGRLPVRMPILSTAAQVSHLPLALGVRGVQVSRRPVPASLVHGPVNIGERNIPPIRRPAADRWCQY